MDKEKLENAAYTAKWYLTGAAANAKFFAGEAIDFLYDLTDPILDLPGDNGRDLAANLKNDYFIWNEINTERKQVL